MTKPFPPKFHQTLDNIRRSRREHVAPVDFQGCANNHQPEANDPERRYQILTSLMLSSQTKDQITYAAGQRLQAAGCGTPEGLLKKTEKDLEDLIKPVGFYRRKAVYLRKAAEILLLDHNGDIPKSIPELCKLPGVGPKMAYLAMTEAWNQVLGIGVDTHVHRIAGRLGWVPANMKNPEDTRKYLESWLPRELWKEINKLLVGFGQTICLPVYTKCDMCYNQSICPSARKLASKKTKKAKVKIEKEAEVCDPKIKSELYDNDNNNDNVSVDKKKRLQVHQNSLIQVKVEF